MINSKNSIEISWKYSKKAFNDDSGCVPLRWSSLGSVIWDGSEHGRSNEQSNLGTWSWSWTSPRNVPLVSKRNQNTLKVLSF